MGEQCLFVLLLSAVHCVFWLSTIADGRMQPAENVFPKVLNDARMQIERSSLEDCHLRFHKFGDYFLEYPIYGVPAKSKEFAHMAAIGWTNGNGITQYRCGGSLISPNFVLTAAHCSLSEGVEPDTIRIGDINIYSPEDDEFVQVFGVREVIKHPEYKFRLNYHDIALIRLRQSAVKTDAVTPACLWTERDVDFSRLEAIGWGLTAYAGSATDILLKVQLTPVTNEDCKKSYDIDGRLKDGIVDSQLCAVDNRMDTCEGDSGGPLQIKLLANERLTPFLMGITSFGQACGLGTPGVYTRISYYIDWIESVARLPFNMTECVARDIKYREFAPDLTAKKIENSLLIEPEKGHISIDRVPKHKAFIGWSSSRRIDWRCTGSLIFDNFILTAASCLQNKRNPDIVKVGALKETQGVKSSPNVQTIRITEIRVHPQYKSSSRQNNLALLKLEQDVRLSKSVLPICLWKDQRNTSLDAGYEIGAIGPEYLNRFFTDETNELDGVRETEFSRDKAYLRAKVKPIDGLACSRFLLNETGEALSNDEFCAGSHLNIIPGTCELYTGSSIEREIWHYDKYFAFLFGINTYAEHCGYGKPAAFTKISKFIDWMEREIFDEPSGMKKIQDLIFIDNDLKCGDPCEAVGLKGFCVKQEYCPKMVDFYKRDKVDIKLCSTDHGGVICCPNQYILDNVADEFQSPTAVSLFRNCPNENLNFRPKGDDYIQLNEIGSEGRPATGQEIPHAVAIGVSQNGYTVELACTGAYIGRGFVLTTASCIESGRLLPNIVRLGGATFSNNVSDKKVQEFTIVSIYTHPQYNRNSRQEHDIALLEMEGKPSITLNVVPACLWSNRTSTPFNLQSFGYDNLGRKKALLTIRPRNPIYQDQCRKIYKNISASQMCIENTYTTNDVCTDKSGDILQYVEVSNKVNIPYIVGIKSYAGNCRNQPNVYTRIPEHIDWIDYISSNGSG